MFTARHAWLSLIALGVFGTVLSGCGKLNLGGGGPAPSGSPSVSPSPTPGACQTISPNGNLVIVGMSNAISPTTAPSYGPIGGYAPANMKTQRIPIVAGVVNQYINAAGKAVPITSQNVLQFVNVETDYYDVVNHSAVGFGGETFPKAPYTFPSAAPKPTAAAISPTAFWSTGRVANNVGSSSGDCFSQVFTLKAGVYYFGDYDYYNVTTTTFRDVLVVGTPTPSAHDVRPYLR